MATQSFPVSSYVWLVASIMCDLLVCSACAVSRGQLLIMARNVLIVTSVAINNPAFTKTLQRMVIVYSVCAAGLDTLIPTM